jgi:hypothetical protein
MSLQALLKRIAADNLAARQRDDALALRIVNFVRDRDSDGIRQILHDALIEAHDQFPDAYGEDPGGLGRTPAEEGDGAGGDRTMDGGDRDAGVATPPEDE